MRIQVFFIGLLGCLFLVACQNVTVVKKEKADRVPYISEAGELPTAPPSKKKSTKNSSTLDSTHYMIQLSEKAMEELNWKKNLASMDRKKFRSIIQEFVSTRLDAVFKDHDGASGDEIAHFCPCGLMLIQANDLERPVIIQQRGTKLEPRPLIDNTGMLEFFGNNYHIPNASISNLSSTIRVTVGPRIPKPRIRPRQKEDTIKVAIIDTGINFNHDSLRNNIWVNTSEYSSSTGENQIDEDGNGIADDFYGYNFADFNHDLTDNKGHGTHIAGIINGSFQNNYFGNASFDTSLELMNLKLFTGTNHTTLLYKAICAMHYAIDNGADVINISWGYSSPDTSPNLRNVVEKAEEEHVFIVASAGNSQYDILEGRNLDGNYTRAFWPASFSSEYPNVISVASAKKHNNLVYPTVSTNFGENSVNFAAIGTEIKSTFIRNGGDTLLSGTSIAAPAITRYIAFLKYKKLQQQSDEDEIYEAILNRLSITSSNYNDWNLLSHNPNSTFSKNLKYNVALKSRHTNLE